MRRTFMVISFKATSIPGSVWTRLIKAANLQRLNKVIAMAHARGIRVSLMADEARQTIPHNPHPPYPDTEKVLYDYTREMVEKMIRQAPAWMPSVSASEKAAKVNRSSTPTSKR